MMLKSGREIKYPNWWVNFSVPIIRLF